MSLSENIFLSMNHKSEFKKGDFINFEKINSYASDVIKNFNVDTPSYNVKAVNSLEEISKIYYWKRNYVKS